MTQFYEDLTFVDVKPRAWQVLSVWSLGDLMTTAACYLTYTNDEVWGTLNLSREEEIKWLGALTLLSILMFY